MSKNITPKVYIIGCSQPDKEGIGEWLSELGVSHVSQFKYVTAFNSPGDTIVELAGRRCYNSFEVGLNPNVSKIRENIAEYIENILTTGHGCYDEETEVLTEDGWKKWEQVSKEDKFATLIGNEIGYQLPIALQSYYYEGEMYKVESSGVDLLITPNHRMYVNKTTTKKGRKKEDYTFITAKELGIFPHSYKKNIPNVDLDKGIHLPHPIMELLGFTIGDGYYSDGFLSFHLKRERKIKYLREICKNLTIDLREDKNNCKYNLTVPDEYKSYFQNIYNKEKEKVIPSYLLTTLSGITLRSLYNGLINSDGSVSRTGVCYDTTSSILAGQIQHLCLIIGLSANISQASCYNNREKSFGNKPLYRIHIVRRNNNIEVNKKSPINKGKTSWVENWKGQVYCCTIPNGLLYVRRNGKPVWCGNSVLEHVTYTFAIENVSRVFTAELNRHRAGMAISEGSLRFIRYTDIPWWIPHSIIPQEGDSSKLLHQKEETLIVFKRAFSQMEDNYRELEDIWELETDTTLTFSFKKALTSLFRRIIGMGVATGGVWTGNIRALRHICELRSEPHVEEEILYVVGLMLQQLKEKEPHLFGDFYLNEGFWRAKYSKV